MFVISSKPRHHLNGARVCAGLAIVLLGACNQTRPIDNVATAAHVQSGAESGLDLERGYRLWKAGDAEQAMKAIRETSWTDPNARFASRPFRLSEAEFLALDASEQERVRDDAVTELASVRDFARDMLNRAQARAQAGEAAEATALRRGIRDFGSCLASPNRHLEIVRLVGEAVQRQAESALQPR